MLAEFTIRDAGWRQLKCRVGGEKKIKRIQQMIMEYRQDDK